ncbi:MAG: tetratricopeptide repeat protein [Pseudomonadota bacterium]|nr:tetratricopeptide repeat protein [Pseudomonadota bacterium]
MTTLFFILALIWSQATAALTDEQAATLRDRAIKHDKKAVAALVKAAEAGDATGQFYVGVLYYFGYGVKKAPKTAAAWFRKAAEQGQSDAQHSLGVMLAHGQGVAKNEAEAAAWFRKAAEQGYADAQNNLGVMLAHGQGVAKNEAEAAAWFRKAAEQGDADAQNNLGWRLKNGQGVAKNEAEAAAWFRKAAEQGDADAQENLGVMLVNGQGVTKNEAEAVAWFQKAAEQGNAGAQNHLGVRLEYGQGVTKNETQALAWYKKAKDSGNEYAQRNHARLDKRLNCAKSATTKLFDSPILCSSREDFRGVLKLAGLQATREDNDYWYDNYNSSTVLEKSQKLTVGYTRAGDLGVVEYSFPGHMDTGLVVWVREMVASKYGWPDDSNGVQSVGEVTYRWRLKDGIEVKVWRGWPDTTSYLTYTVPEYKAVMDGELEANRREKEAEKFTKQNKAF